MSIKPILFNTAMTRAILDGRKTVTRRVVKFEKVFNGDVGIVYPGKCGLGVGLFSEFDNARVSKKPPYRLGDILYVRETWNRNPLNEYGNEPEKHIYKASYDGHAGEVGWHPSIHMPKEAARIWLKVTNVQVKRLQDIDNRGCAQEGIKVSSLEPYFYELYKPRFKNLWNSTVNKTETGSYGWDANPWVWVIEFERCEKPVAN